MNGEKRQAGKGNWLHVIIALFFIFYNFFHLSAEIESASLGYKYITNYTSYMHPRNWSIVQDKRGFIYIANNGCVLEFDGVSKRIINIPGDTVRSLATDEKGVVYVGGKNELGYLAQEKLGRLYYISLVNYLTGEQKTCDLIQRISITQDGVYFRCKKFLFHWQPESKKMTVLEPEKEFNASFVCSGRLFVHQRGIGLMEMKKRTLKMIQGREIFNTGKIFMMAPFEEGPEKLLIGTLERGFFIYDGHQAVPFPTEIDSYILTNELYHGIRLRSTGEFALATSYGGLVIMDKYGRKKHLFDKTTGLKNNDVSCVYEDRQGNLWLALSKGFAKIEYASPFSFFNEELANLTGNVLAIVGLNEQYPLLVGTDNGLFVLQGNRFQPVAGLNGTCWFLLPVERQLLAAFSDGVFLLDEKLNIMQTIIHDPSYVLLRSKVEPARVFVGSKNGLIALRCENKSWREEQRFPKITDEIRTIVEETQGNLWLGTLSAGLIKVDFVTTTQPLTCQVTRYHNGNGLTGDEVKVFFSAQKTFFVAKRKLYYFDEKDNSFKLDSAFGKEYTDGSKNIFLLQQDQQHHLWFHAEFRNFRVIPQPGKPYFIDEALLKRIPAFQVNAIYPEGHVIWFGGVEGVVRYDTRIKQQPLKSFNTFIREIEINSSSQFYDDVTGAYKKTSFIKKNKLELPFAQRNLVFYFATPAFAAEENNQYRCLLERYESQWSNWQKEPKKVYTNLDSGAYTFRVRAQDVHGQISEEAIFQVRILPPWYKTWWAITLFIVSLLVLFFLWNRWRLGKLERETRYLEKMVQERTHEINDKNQTLETQALQLLQQADQLKEMDRIKSRFFTNISHEFRTPLTLIIGPLESMLAEPRSEKDKHNVQMMLRNSRRLLELINQLLDLAKLDSGKMKLKAGLQDIISFLRGITASFEGVAQQKQIKLLFQADVEVLVLYFDREKMALVITNLLVNAIKYTPAYGEVSVLVQQDLEKNPAIVEISVMDTGVGIAREHLPHIFDRFYQVDIAHAEVTNNNHSYVQGTGIGLALAKEMVVLHHGTIDVQSSVDRDPGTEFTIRLPMGKAHLAADEMIEPGENGAFHTYTMPILAETPETQELEPEEEKESEQGKDIILIVEDNADARRFIRDALAAYYTVKEAGDGEQGIQLAQEIIPDLIVSDVMMPGKDGYELCHTLKTDIKTSHIPIILLTAKASEESVVQGLETGADDYITKPFSSRILVARIRNIIELRRQWQRSIQREMNFEPAEVQVSSMDQAFMKEVIDLIEKNLSDQFFNVEQMVKKLFMSRTTLYRKVLALTGLPPREFIRSYRLKRGAQLLKANFGNVTEVALEVGFSSTTYFGKCFKEQFHCLPSEYVEGGGK